MSWGGGGGGEGGGGGGGGGGGDRLDYVGKFAAPAPGDEQPDADGGAARRHGHNRGGGEGCGYAAPLRQRKRVAHIPTAEAARSGLMPEGQGQARSSLCREIAARG